MTHTSFARGLACFVACLAFGGVAFGQSADLAKDARLQKLVSVKMKIVPIATALSQISRFSGVSLDQAPSIKDLKITVLVQDVPAGIVLDKIAKTLGCEWRADGQLYRLGMDADEQNARTRYVEAEDSAAQKEIVDELDAISKVAQMDPAAAEKELIELTGARADPKNTTAKTDPEREKLLKHAANRQDVMLGRFLQSMSAGKVSAFWRGEVVAVNPNLANERGGGPPVPGRQGRANGGSPNGMPLFVQYDPLLYRVQVMQGFGVRFVAKRLPRVVTQPLPTGALAKLRFGKEVLSWDMPIPSDDNWTKLGVARSDPQSHYANHLYALADFLEKAFDQTQVPIVADAFRTPMQDRDFNSGIGSFPSWMSHLKSNNGLMTRFEDGVMMVRHGGFWRLRKFETPEDELAAIEAKTPKLSPTLADYSAFVTKLTPEQAKPFCLRDGVLVNFDATPIQLGFPALKFYAGLDRNAISMATRDGIPFGEMSSSLRASFTDAVIEGVFYGAASGSFPAELVRFAASGDGRGLGFIMRSDDMYVNGTTIIGQDLIFGSSLTNAAIYKLPVSQ